MIVFRYKGLNKMLLIIFTCFLRELKAASVAHIVFLVDRTWCKNMWEKGKKRFGGLGWTGIWCEGSGLFQQRKNN